MNKKQNIQIAIIVVFFALAALILYKGGLFGGGQTTALPTAQSASSTAQAILPYGDTPLDVSFKSVIDPSRFQYNIVQYPVLDPQNDVGIPENSLIAPLPTPQGK